MLMLEKWWSWAWLLWVVLPTTCGYTIAERNRDDEKNRRDFFGTVNKFCLQLE